MSDCEAKLQAMLKCLNDWCKQWGLVINFEKSKIVYFRPVVKPDQIFNFSAEMM